MNDYQEIRRSPLLKAAVLLSLALHLAMGLLVYLFPAEKKESGTPFVTRLVTPEEMEGNKGVPKTPPLSRPQRMARPPVRPQAPGRISPQGPPSVVPQPEPDEAGAPPSPEVAGKGRGEAKTGSPPSDQGVYGQEGVQGGRGPLSSEPGDIRRTPVPSIRDKLFDREIIEKFAKREEARKRDNTITFDTEEFRYHTYMMRLKEKIEGIWKYPPEEAMKGIYGDLYIRFTIKKNGMLGDMELVRTSGHRRLDEAAKQALRDAQPFWPLPEEWGKEGLTVTGHFIYSLYGTYIR